MEARGSRPRALEGEMGPEKRGQRSGEDRERTDWWEVEWYGANRPWRKRKPVPESRLQSRYLEEPKRGVLAPFVSSLVLLHLIKYLMRSRMHALPRSALVHLRFSRVELLTDVDVSRFVQSMLRKVYNLSFFCHSHIWNFTGAYFTDFETGCTYAREFAIYFIIYLDLYVHLFNYCNFFDVSIEYWNHRLLVLKNNPTSFRCNRLQSSLRADGPKTTISWFNEDFQDSHSQRHD